MKATATQRYLQAKIDERANNWEHQKALLATRVEDATGNKQFKNAADKKAWDDLDREYNSLDVLIDYIDNGTLPETDSAPAAVLLATSLLANCRIDNPSAQDRDFIAQVHEEALSVINRFPAAADGKFPVASQRTLHTAITNSLQDVKNMKTVGNTHSPLIGPVGSAKYSHSDVCDVIDGGYAMPKEMPMRAIAQELESRGRYNGPGHIPMDDEKYDPDKPAASFQRGIRNNMSEGTGSSGGYLVPTIISADLIDLARAEARVMQAGATIHPMTRSPYEIIPKWTGDPTPAFTGEGAPVTETDGTVNKILLQAHSLTAITIISRELLEDTDMADDLLRAFAKRFALTIDETAMYGNPAANANSPTGIKYQAGVNVATAAGAVNGYTIGSAPETEYNLLVDAVGRLRDVNEDPNAFIMSDRSRRNFAKLVSTQGLYIEPPSYLDDLETYTTNQVPNNLTVGTANTTSDIFTADWSKLIIGVRGDVRFQQLNERYVDTNQIGFFGWWRGDIAVARPAAFDVMTGLL